MFNSIYKFWATSIKRQLIIGIALIHAILMSFFIYDLVNREKSFLLEQNRFEAQALAKTLAANGTSWILANDTIGIEEVINSQKNFLGLKYAMFLNMEGKVLGYTNRRQVNRYVSDNISLKLMTTPNEVTTLFENTNLIDVAAPVLVKSKQIGWARVGISRTGINQNLNFVIKNGILYTLLTIAIGIVFAWFMAKGFTLGLIQLRSATNKITLGERQANCNLNRYDELGDLSRDLNQMLAIINSREREQTEILRAIVDGVIIMDSTGKIETFNHTAEKIFGYKASEIIEKNISTLIQCKLSKEFSGFFKYFIQTDKKNNLDFGKETIGLHKSKHTFPLRLSITELPRSPSGEKRYIGFCNDLTIYKQKDEQIRRSQKMDALGHMTGGIAHDYNNMLGIISGYTELIGLAVTDNNQLTKYTNEVQHAVERGVKLTAKLLAFTRKKNAHNEEININALLLNRKNMLEKTLTARINLKFVFNEELWDIWVDVGDFEDMIINMSINSMHAIEKEGNLIFKTNNQKIDTYNAQLLQITQGDYVVLEVSDSGCGMDDEIKSKIFDPFFSTKKDKGTGLGLSQVYGFLVRSGGTIKVDSQPGLGTIFTIYLPRFKTEQTTNQQTVVVKHKTQSLQGHEVILVVDDEVSLLEVTGNMLEQRGYKVYKSLNGQEALKILSKHTVQLVLTDVIMPDMSGIELSEIININYPNVKILLASGYNKSQFSQAQNDLSKYESIQKPFAMQELLKKVRNILDSE